MLIGVIALGYGFIQGAGHHTDEEVTHQIEAFANDLQLYMVDYNDSHHSVEEVILYLYFIKMKNFILHFTNDEMMEAQILSMLFILQFMHYMLKLSDRGRVYWSQLFLFRSLSIVCLLHFSMLLR